MRICDVAGCDKKHLSRGFCGMHYARVQRTGSTDGYQKLSCSIEGCAGAYKTHGWCEKHYERWKSNGDPLVTQRDWGNGKTAEVVTYEGLHWRLRKYRGAARTYVCQCGKPAEQWAYDHQDPNELWGDANFGDGRVLRVPYSLDLSHYAPMCRPCHRDLDLNYKQEVAS